MTDIKESFQKYLDYLDSDEEFAYKLRMELEWDDAEYLHMRDLVLAVIDEYKGTNLVPVPVVLFFTSGIGYIEGITGHAQFFSNTTAEYQQMVQERKAELQDLRRRFFSGELFANM